MRASLAFVATLIVSACAVPIAAECAASDPVAMRPAAATTVTVSRARLLMGTLLEARIEAASDSAGAVALAAALDEVARLEVVMSSWRGDSEIAGLNGSGRRGFALSADLAAVLDSALAFAAATDGTFDPTVDPLLVAWDIRGAGRVPGAEALANARARTCWPALELDRSARTARFARDSMGVDLGGIGKGYALDRMADELAAHGIARGWLDFGGQVRVLDAGDLATREAPAVAARVPIAHPEDRERACVTLPLASGSASTSAQRERSFERGGRRYGHVIDPRSGQPVPGRASVTVVAASGTRADALSTALLVMGRDAAARFAASHPDVGVLWLEPAGRAVHAWCWNLRDVAVAKGATVRWISPEPAPGLTLRTKGSL